MSTFSILLRLIHEKEKIRLKKSKYGGVTRYSTVCGTVVFNVPLDTLSPVHTKLNSTQSTLLKVDRVDRVALARYTLVTKSTISATKLTILATKSMELATMSTVTSCRIQVVADLSPKLATKSTICNSRLCCQFVTGFGNSRRCRQCVLGSIDPFWDVRVRRPNQQCHSTEAQPGRRDNP